MNDFYRTKNHPVELECLFLKALRNDLVYTKISPHIPFCYNYDFFSVTKPVFDEYSLKDKFRDHVIKQKVIVSVCEHIGLGSLSDLNTENWKLVDWKVIIFQIIYTLYILQSKYKMIHCDFHCDNLLVDDTRLTESHFVYNVLDTSYYLPNVDKSIKIWDFEFANSYRNNEFFDNQFLNDVNGDNNIPTEYNDYYDLHYFFFDLIDSGKLDEDLVSEIQDMYPVDAFTYLEETEETEESEYEENESDQDQELEYSNNSNGTIKRAYSSEQEYDSSESAYSELCPRGKYTIERRIINSADPEWLKTLPNPKNFLRSRFFAEFRKEPSNMKQKTVFEYK
jgi:hypothetical protein